MTDEPKDHLDACHHDKRSYDVHCDDAEEPGVPVNPSPPGRRAS